MNNEERQKTALNVAKMYYVNGDSQEYIAEITGMSRSNISRILKKCISDGVVEFIVHDTISENAQLAHKLKMALGLKEVIIVPSADTQDKLDRNIGERLSLYLIQILEDEMLLGVARGRSIYYAGRSLQNVHHIRVDTVQLQGAISFLATMDESNGLISLFANKLNGKGYVLNAPLMVKSSFARKDLISSSMVSNVLQKYCKLNAAVFEIERPELYATQRHGVTSLTKADILQLSEVDVTASVCGHYYNRCGIPCNAGINDRIISIDPNLLKNVEYSIGISSGRHSLNATLSILKAKLVNVLITDENLASQLESFVDKNSL